MLPCTITNRFPAHIRFFNLPNATLDHSCLSINANQSNSHKRFNSTQLLHHAGENHSPPKPSLFCFCFVHDPLTLRPCFHEYDLNFNKRSPVLLYLHYVPASRTQDGPHKGLVDLDVNLCHRLLKTRSERQGVAGCGEPKGVVVDREGEGGGGEGKAGQAGRRGRSKV